jgi:NAD(P)-dependent dehydrogenase (short-subunit alcohol dehydrogenase family)
MSSRNEKAIVVGGSRGLGRGAVEALRARGLEVVALARDATELSATAAATGATAVPGDATDAVLARRLLVEVNPDLVVLVAGASPLLAPIHEQTWESFSHNFGVDTRATFEWLKLALTVPMRRGGHLIVISSGAALRGSPVSGGYAAAKRAQAFISDYAATEVERAGLGLRIQTVFPALNPSTDLGRHAIAAYAARAGVTPEEFAKRFGPPLTPAIFGQAIAELHADPAKWPERGYSLSGAGLAATAA